MGACEITVNSWVDWINQRTGATLVVSPPHGPYLVTKLVNDGNETFAQLQTKEGGRVLRHNTPSAIPTRLLKLYIDPTKRVG